MTRAAEDVKDVPVISTKAAKDADLLAARRDDLQRVLVTGISVSQRLETRFQWSVIRVPRRFRQREVFDEIEPAIDGDGDVVIDRAHVWKRARPEPSRLVRH